MRTLRPINLALGLALAVSLPRVVLAQEPLALTLEDAIGRGVAHAPALAESRARESAAQSTITSRAAQSSPTVTTSAGYLRTNHVQQFGLPLPDGGFQVVFPDIPNNYQTRAEVDVPVYTAGRVSALVQSARADLGATQADRSVTEQDLRLQIVDAYWTLVTARANVRVLTDALHRTDASVADVKSRLDAGFVPPNELLSAQAQRAHESVALIEAENAASIAEADLDRLIGEDPGRPLSPTTTVDEPIAGSADLAAQPLDALIVRARTGRSEREMLRDQQTSITAAGAAALAALRPSVAAYGAVEPARPNQLFVPRTDTWQTSWNLGVNVNWALWDGGKSHADYAASVAQADAVGHELDDLDAHIVVEVRERKLDLSSARDALDAAATEVGAATEALRVVQARFAAGVATTTDILNAEVALREADLERTQLAAALRVSEARLMRAVGAL